MRTPVSILVALLLTLTCAAAVATTVIAMDLEKLSKASDVVVIADVVEVSAIEQNGRVFTHVDLKVVETLKGSPNPTFTIVHIGGRTERLATRVAGMPSFTKFERALLFLEQPKGYDHYVVTGLEQGKVDLKQEDGRWIVKPGLSSSHTVKPKRLPSGDLKLQPATPTMLQPQTLEALRAKVAALIDGQSSKTATP